MDFANSIFFCIFALLFGSMTEWLGSGLQNRVQRFESAWNLCEKLNREDYQKIIFAVYSLL